MLKIYRDSTDRNLSDTVYVIAIPQDKYGEQFKRESILLTDEDNDLHIKMMVVGNMYQMFHYIL